MTEEPRRLGGRYELGEVLGRGGMAEVRKARDIRLGRDVAVKLLRVDLATDATFQARFRKEAQAAANLNHPNIVAVYDTGEEPDPVSGVLVPYIVMELVVGHTLRDILRDGRRIVPEKALEMTQGVLDALAYSHKAGIVHRDIKPANVMLTPTGTVKVMDFGIARAVSDTSSTMTATAAVIGTAQYLSPEQARGEVVDNRSDVYSTGCLLYELLTGRPPFSGDSPVSVAYQHVRETPVPPSQLDSLVTPEMDAIVMKALAKEADDRYQTATEMRSDIASALGGQPIIAKPVPAATALMGESPTALLTTPPEAEADATAIRTSADGRPARAVEPEEEKKKMKGSTIALITLASLVAVALIVTGLVFFLPRQAEKVAVPQLLNTTQSVAEQMLKDAELIPAVEKIEGPDDSTVGTVIKQNPTANVEVEKGSTVTITINIGPDKLTIPSNLVGKNVDTVVAELKKAGFSNVDKKTAPDEPVTAQENEVTSLNNAEGASVAADTPIIVYYATGRSPVPNLRGMTRDEAREKAIEEGFTNTSFDTKDDPNATEGTVIEQSPASGTDAKRTDLLIIYLARRPTPTTPPTTSPPTSSEPTESVTSPSEGDEED
jgi:serine/threonine-protein kinase